ncbi:MAG: class I SAM-dependent methyltransferase [Alphaproteobacteria bacterium]|nr:class I SAM-dependent methyltransferase [Alphaproteobacteria bacterium]
MKVLNKLPAYMQILGNKRYSNSWLSGILDDSRVAHITSCFTSKKIMKDMLRDITKNAHVLQIGLNFGSEISTVFNKIRKKGKLDIFDVSDTQIKKASERYSYKINIMNYNATLPWDEKYDVVICYNLLRELPLDTRKKVMDNALGCLTNGGKAIFIDYAKPEWWHPLKWPLFLYNRLFFPFAESLWEKPIESFCSRKDEFRWSHSYYQGNLYQKVVAVRKILSSDDVIKLTKLFREKE